MTRTITALAASLTACALCAPAHASSIEASASVLVTGLTFELIDLDLTDGIAPSLQYVEGESRTKHWQAVASGAKWTSPGPNVNEPSDIQTALSSGGNWFVPLQAGVNTPQVQSSAVMTTSSISLSASATLGTVTAGEQTNLAYADLTSAALDMFPDWIIYTVTPNTAVRVTGQYELSSRVLAQDPQGYGSATAYLQLMMWGNTDRPAVVEASASSNLDTSDDSRNGSFDWLLSNASTESEQQSFFLLAGASAQANGRVTAVPEPTSLALLLAGAGIASITAARRRSAQRH